MTGGALAQPTAAVPPAERVMRLAMMENIPRLTDQPLATLTQVYAHLGYRLEVTPLPFARSLLTANYGDYDGELARLTQIEETAHQLKPDIPHVKALPRFASVPLYHYLHVRNAALIPALTAEITRVTGRKK